jgi:hypothetical protein
MRFKYLFLCSVFSLLAIQAASCFAGDGIFSDPPIQDQVKSRCLLPPNQRGMYATPIEIRSFRVRPERASREIVNGCASIRFRLDERGHAVDATIMAESPSGYGFGDALLRSVQGSTYRPPMSTRQWYYILATTVYNRNVPNGGIKGGIWLEL